MTAAIKWSPEDEARLREMVDAGEYPMKQIVEFLTNGASVGSAYVKAKSMGLDVVATRRSARVALFKDGRSAAKEARMEVIAKLADARAKREAMRASEIITYARRGFTKPQIAALTKQPYRNIETVLGGANHDQQ